MSALLQADRPDFSGDLGGSGLFERTVPRALVHRSAVAEVLLTGIHATGENAFRVGAQWARGHSFYGAVAGRWHDPMLFGESIRQTGLLLAHAMLGVPMEFQFLTDQVSFDVCEEGVRLAAGPAEIVLEVALRDFRCRGRHVSSFSYDVVAHRDGQRIGSGRGAGSCVAPSVYRRLRGHRVEASEPCPPPPPLAPRLVGRTAEFDVVLGDQCVGGVRPLRARADHPVLFDHPVDHIPGMVLMEAARQAALAELRSPDGLLVGCAATFGKYVELDTPCLVWVAAEPADGSGRRALAVEFRQGGAVAGACRVAILDGRGE